MQVIRSGLGPLPLAKDKDDKDGGAEEAAEEAPARAPAPASNRPAVLPDGSYATQVCPACPPALHEQMRHALRPHDATGFAASPAGSYTTHFAPVRSHVALRVSRDGVL